MGIKGLSKFLKDFGVKKTLEDYSSKVLAIDTSIYLYKYKYNTEGNNFLRKFVAQVSSFKKRGITPVYIFEGKPPPEKKLTTEKRKNIRQKQILQAQQEEDFQTRVSIEKNIIKISKEDVENLQKVFKLCNVHFIQCEDFVEGERYCAFLNKNGYVDMVLSNDFDSLTFGCKKLLTFNGNNEYVEYDLDAILTGLDINHDQFIEMCIACGSDYFPQGVMKFGPVKSLKTVKSHGDIENWGVEINEAFDVKMIRSIFKTDPQYIGCLGENDGQCDTNSPELRELMKSLGVYFI